MTRDLSLTSVIQVVSLCLASLDDALSVTTLVERDLRQRLEARDDRFKLPYLLGS